MRFFGILFVLCAVVSSTIAQNKYTEKKRTIYGLCPPGFTQINGECYYVSDAKASWLDAHFECKDKNSRLAEPMKFADKRLRKYLVAKDKQRTDLWIGGTYDWKSKKWQWGHSGKEIKYNSFSANDLKKSPQLEYHCAVLDPSKMYRWSAKLCSERYRFVCQHKMPKVSRKNREKIYSRWNTTYPNQMANEFLLEVTEIQVNGTRKHRRIRPVSPNESIRARTRSMSARNPGQLSINDVRYPTHLAPEDQTDFSNGAPPETRRLPRTHLEEKPETLANRDNTPLTEFDRRVEFQRRQEYERKQRRRQMHRRKLQREREERARAEQQAKERYEMLKKEKELSETHHHQLPPTLPPVQPTERTVKEVRPTQQTNVDDQMVRTTQPPVVLVAETEQPPEVHMVRGEHNEVDNSVFPSDPEEQHRQHLLQLQEEAQKAEEYRKSQVSENSDTANSLYEAERVRLEQARRRVEEQEKKREEERKLREEIMRKENEELQRLAQEMRERELADRRALEEEEERLKLEEEARQREEIQKVQARAEKRRKAEQRRRLILRKRTEEAERKAKENQQEAERIRQQKIRERIQNLSPEKRELFFKEREKRQKRRLERQNANNVDNLE